MKKGVILAFSAYIFWGLHPVYWKMLQRVPPFEIVSYRIFWSFVFFTIILFIRKDWKTFITKFKNLKRKWLLILPAFLIGSNWATYIWAVNSDYILETSMGYFICPLLSVFLGVAVLKEKLRAVQWFAVGLAGIGVLAMTIIYGQFPWIALFLAGTWAVYGLLRKKSPLNSVEGLTLETAVLSLFSLSYIFYLTGNGQGSFLSDWSATLLLIGAGVISGLPLIIFITAARLINFSLIGIIQYIYPTLIFLIGFLIYDEPLNPAKLTGFTFIWTALMIYTVESVVFIKRRAKLSVI
ncbi:MAG: EamA family transporter RarD [Calditrichaceae bacterium]|jgi:chloramphenicol-sensitive protein RarD